MSQFNIATQDVVIAGKKVATLNKIMIDVQYTLDMTDMYVPYSVYDSESGFVGTQGVVYFDQANLAGWGSDDSYILNQIVAAAGVTLV